MQGNRDSFNSLFSKYRDLVYEFSMRALGDHDKAQEATQRTMVFCWQKMVDGKFNPESGKFKGWILAVCKNNNRKVREGRAMDDALWHRNHPRVPVETDIVFDAVSSKDLYPKIDQALREILSPQQYQVFVMHSEGLTTKQIARNLSIHPSSVRSNLRHARKKLHNNVQKLDIT